MVQYQLSPHRNVWCRIVRCAVVLGIVCAVHAQAMAADLPNIVLLVADDLGWRDVSYHGGDIRTPNIDRLAREGLELDRYYVAPVCSPTRAGYMTGRYPIRYGLMRAVIPPWSSYGLPTEEAFLPEMLEQAGYRHRGIVGKWHLGHSARKYHPISRGFTTFYGHYNGAIDYFTHEREGELDWHRQFDSNYDQGYSTDLIAGEAVRFINAHASEGPFFLYVPFNAPHSPFQALQKYLDAYERLEGRALRSNRRGAGRNVRQTYAAMVASMDEGVGHILRALDTQGIADNTLVLFSSDNGGVANVADNAPLRGAKASVFEGGIRVPAAIRWPAGLPGGHRINAPMANIDLYPTLQHIVKHTARLGKPLDGVDMLNVLRGEVSAPERSLFNYIGQQGEASEQLSVMTSEWKLIRLGPNILWEPGRAKTEPDIFLFRITEDPYEQQNVADLYPEIVVDLLTKIREFRATQPANGVRPYAEGREGFVAPKEWSYPEE